MNKLNLSALVLAKNEEETLAGCLKRLDFAKEIIVLDQNSTDKTSLIAKKMATKVFKSNDQNFASNRNFLAQKAQCPWILYLDPDERINEENIKEIENSIKDPLFDAYYFPRKNIILGRWLKYGGWWPDYVPRLFKKDSLSGWEGDVHESPKIVGGFGYFHHPIDHLTGRSMGKMFEKTIKWGEIEAGLYAKSGYPKVTKLKILRAMTREFVQRYFLKRGFLDGKVGLIESVYQALHMAIVFVYLWEIQNKADLDK